MPVKHNVRIVPVSEDEFHLLDHKIMGLVFSVQKDLGRFCDEKIYQNELAYRCKDMGFDTVATEVPIEVSYKDFVKTYYMDLLINDRVMYELKTVTVLTGEHRKQALNYLLLLGMHHGKLINMRPQSVQHSFISTRLNTEMRYKFAIDDGGWEDLDEDSIWLRQLMVDLLAEWGAFLDTSLFYDAVVYFRGGEENVVKRIEILNNSRVLGIQRAHLLNSETAFKISAVTKSTIFFERRLRKFLSHTPLKAVQWINFNHDKIEFLTISQ